MLSWSEKHNKTATEGPLTNDNYSNEFSVWANVGLNLWMNRTLRRAMYTPGMDGQGGWGAHPPQDIRIHAFFIRNLGFGLGQKVS